MSTVPFWNFIGYLIGPDGPPGLVRNEHDQRQPNDNLSGVGVTRRQIVAQVGNHRWAQKVSTHWKQFGSTSEGEVQKFEGAWSVRGRQQPGERGRQRWYEFGETHKSLMERAGLDHFRRQLILLEINS